MYNIKKSETFIDQLKVTNEAGESLVMDIALNINPTVVKEYRALQVRLMDLDKQRQTDPEKSEIIEQIGRAVCDLITLLFGAENFRKMDDYYAGDYVTLLADITPYIWDVIAPKLQDLSKARKAQLKRRFK